MSKTSSSSKILLMQISNEFSANEKDCYLFKLIILHDLKIPIITLKQHSEPEVLYFLRRLAFFGAAIFYKLRAWCCVVQAQSIIWHWKNVEMSQHVRHHLYWIIPLYIPHKTLPKKLIILKIWKLPCKLKSKFASDDIALSINRIVFKQLVP